MTKDDVDSARRMKAYILPEADKLCMVLKGEFLEHVTKTERQKHPGLTYLLIGEEYWDDPEDAALREAWERLKRDTRLHTARFYPPDGYYVLRGPGVVECKTCERGWIKHPFDRTEDPLPCSFCNPTGLEHPTLIPLAEAGLEEIPKYHEAHDWPNQFLVGRPDIPALVVVREEECPNSDDHSESMFPWKRNEVPKSGPIMKCPECKGTGKVERVEVQHSRDCGVDP